MGEEFTNFPTTWFNLELYASKILFLNSNDIFSGFCLQKL